MKLYRCFLGILLVFFIALAVLYITAVYNEQRSIEEGILVYHLEVQENQLKGGESDVTGHSLC